MYQIIFSPKLAAWQIQILTYGLLWISIRAHNKTEPVTFKNFDEARTYADSIGLDQVYRNRADTPAHHIMQGGYQPAVAHFRRGPA